MSEEDIKFWMTVQKHEQEYTGPAYTETLKTWTELNINQKRQVRDWFRADEVINDATKMEFIIDDTDVVVGCTDQLTCKWEAELEAYGQQALVDTIADLNASE